MVSGSKQLVDDMSRRVHSSLEKMSLTHDSRRYDVIKKTRGTKYPPLYFVVYRDPNLTLTNTELCAKARSVF